MVIFCSWHVNDIFSLLFKNALCNCCLFCFVASKDGTSEYNRLCGCVSNNVQAINKNGIYI